MVEDDAIPDRFGDLRKRAEAKLDRTHAEDTRDLSPEETRILVHELQTYQIELEMQNHELREAQEELVNSRDRYSDLYDFAPVGYLTTNNKGLILEANLTLTTMLGVERRNLVQRNLSAFIVSEDQDSFYRHCRGIGESKRRNSIQLRVLRRAAQPFWAELDSTLIEVDDPSDVQFRIVIVDITVRRQAEEALSLQVTRDALTGLINRGEFEHRLERVLDRARQLGEQHALCYLDLDQFKVINDTCGHMAGDELLRQLAQLLSMRLRARDTLARLGGDEFGVLIEHCTLRQARRVAGEVRRAVADFRFEWAGRGFRIGISIGLVPITETSESVSNLLSAADSACYAAKDEGRNRVHVYHLDDIELANRQGEMRWVSRIDQAIEDERLQLWLQPILPLAAGPVGGGQFELLLRLIDEQGAIIPAKDFLPAAERYGLSTKLDRWVIGAALGWLDSYPKRLGQLERCFINLSGASLADEDFLEFVQEHLEQSRVASRKICFEVTETATIANLSRARAFMSTVRGHGCRFALDDFGSGLSSFAYLKSLPVDYLKIDGLFVKDIMDDEVDLALVRAINNIGKVMGKVTIAESVENNGILQKLREIGVDHAQGYGIGRPRPLEEVAFFDATNIPVPASSFDI